MAIPIHNCADLQRSLRFYLETLGATLLWDDAQAVPMIASVKWRDHELYLSAHRGDGVQGAATYLIVPDVDEVYAELLERGLVPPDDDDVHRAPTDQTWGMREFYVRDPDRNCLRFASKLAR